MGARVTERRRQRRLRAKYTSGDQEETEGEHVSTTVGSTQDNNEAQRKINSHTIHGNIHKDMGMHVDACMPKHTNRPSARAIEDQSRRGPERPKIGVTEDQN